jgi:hypothetical protein
MKSTASNMKKYCANYAFGSMRKNMCLFARVRFIALLIALKGAPKKHDHQEDMFVTEDIDALQSFRTVMTKNRPQEMDQHWKLQI